MIDKQIKILEKLTNSKVILKEIRFPNAYYEITNNFTLPGLDGWDEIFSEGSFIHFDSNNKTILKETDIVPIGLQNEFIKEFSLPSQITPGGYKLFAQINYEDQEKEANSQGSFEIISGKREFFSSPTGKAIFDFRFCSKWGIFTSKIKNHKQIASKAGLVKVY